MAQLAFDLTPGACSACATASNASCTQCVRCEASVHVMCYPKATTTRRWMCDLCDAHLSDAECVLCGGMSSCGILQRLSQSEVADFHLTPQASAASSADLFAHTFCLTLYRNSPSKSATCRICHKPHARLSCELCQTSFHPFCALKQEGTLQHTRSGNVLCYCEKHNTSEPNQRAPAAAAAASSNTSGNGHKPVTLKRESPTTGSTAAATAIPVAPASATAVTAAAPPIIPVATSSRSPRPVAPVAAAAAPVASAAATNRSATVAAAVAAAAAATKTGSSSNISSLTPAAAPPVKAPSKPSAKDAFIAQRKEEAAAAAAAAAASPKPSPPKLASTATLPVASSKRTHSPASKQAAAAAAAASSSAASATKPTSAASSKVAASTAVPVASSKSSGSKAVAAALAAPASKSSAASPKKAAASSSAAAASKPAKPASSSAASSASSSKSVAASSSAAAAKASTAKPAAAASRFTSHPSTRGVDYSMVSDSDEGEAEWDGGGGGGGASSSSASCSSSEDPVRRAQRRAIREIRESREQEADIPEDNCRVCGESWAEDAQDEEGNEENDEMVGCEGCDCYYHQSCYGIKKVPKGDFYCHPCAAGFKRGEVECQICKSKDWRGFCVVKYDPLKDRSAYSASRKRKHFAHIDCVKWCGATSFENVEYRNPAVGLEDIPQRLFTLPCIKCTRLDGAKLQCQYKACARAFHPLCGLNHQDEFLMDDHMEDPDIIVDGEATRPPKEFYCPHHSKRIRRQKERDALLAAGESTSDIDLELAELDRVVPTTTLLPPNKLVTVVPPKQGGRAKKKILEFEGEDQEARLAEYKHSAEQIKTKVEEDMADDRARALRKADRSAAAAAAAGQKRKISAIDADVESVDSDVSDDSMASQRKRLKKVSAGSKQRLRLELVLTDEAAAAAASASARDLEITSASNPQIETRSSARSALQELLGNDLSTALEAGIFEGAKRSTGHAYAQRLAEFRFNLKENAELHQAVVTHKIPIAQLLTMTNLEMATKKQKEVRDKEAKETMRGAIGAPLILQNNLGKRYTINPLTGQRVPMEDVETKESTK